MAKKKIPRKKRVQAQKKPQPLPKSVQALLRYLGGSDVKIASSARQSAIIAQPIAPLYQAPQGQGQQQQQQAQPLRQQPVGQTIAASPLARLAPPPRAPQPTPVAQAPIIIKQSKKEAAPASSELALIKSKVGSLEQGLSSFKEQATIVGTSIFEGIRQTQKALKFYQGQDYDPLDSEVDVLPASKPYVAEQGLLVSTVAPKPARSLSVPTRATAAFEGPEIEAGQGAYAAGKYVTAAASPELTPRVVLKGKAGRKPDTEEVKAQKAEAKKLEKEQRKQQLKTAGEQLYSEGPSAAKALEALTSSIAIKKKAPKIRETINISSLRTVDPSTQVEFLASGGGAAAAPQQRGKTVLEMMGGGGAAKK
jgi:hypothetical protein